MVGIAIRRDQCPSGAFDAPQSYVGEAGTDDFGEEVLGSVEVQRP